MSPSHPMLPLDAARWRELTQAFGSAEDVPRLLAHLDLVDDVTRRELWLGLWGTLWRDGAAFTGSYAAVPHLVAWAATREATECARALHLVGAIALGRAHPASPALPDDLAPAYHEAIARVPGIVASRVAEPWDPDTTQVLASLLAIAKGHPGFGGAALQLEPIVTCPVCGDAHPPAGWGAAA